MTANPASDVQRPHVVAVILSYNSLPTLCRVLESVRGQTVPVDRVVVVDNASGDDTATYLNRELPSEDLVLSRTNLGVGSGHWAGWSRAIAGGTDLIWSLEHDTIPEPDCLERLLDAYATFRDRVSVGAVACPQHHAAPVQQLSARILRVARHPLRLLRRHGSHARNDAFLGGQFTFNGTLLPGEVIAKLGPPRQDFFVDKEDREYALRMVREGYGIVRQPTATVRHLKQDAGGLPSVMRTYYGTRNGVYLERHVQHRPLAAVRAWLRLAPASARILLLSRERRKHLRAKVRGTVDGLGGRLGQPTYSFLGHPS